MEHHHHSEHHSSHVSEENIFNLAVSATLHCLLGCGIGEVLGMTISMFLGLSLGLTMVLSMGLGFVMGLALGILPLLRKNVSLTKALKLVIIGEGLSIFVMESFELGTQLIIPGLIEAGLSDGLFWVGMAGSLLVGFIAALPVNYWMIKRGVRHAH